MNIIQPDWKVANQVQAGPYEVVCRELAEIAEFEATDGRVRIITIPRETLEFINSDEEIRAIAVGVNNIVAVLGARHLKFRDGALVERISDCVSRHYRHVLEPAHFPNPSADSVVGKSEFPSGAELGQVQQSIGINVGQSFVKAAVAGGSSAECLELVRRRTFGQSRSASELQASILEMSIELRQRFPAAVSLGLAVGGIVENGAIAYGSGITSGFDRVDAAKLIDLPRALAGEVGLPVFVCQDVRAKAFYHSLASGRGRTMILDVGTSLGGAIVDSSGVVENGHNQIGRMAIDISPSALNRADGGGEGLMSQYLSARGILAMLNALNVRCSGIDSLESLDGLLSEGSRSQLVSRLYKVVDIVTKTLLSRYDFDRIVFTGGMMRLPYIREVVRDERSLAATRVEFEISTDPVYDGAIGVAVASSKLAYRNRRP